MKFFSSTIVLNSCFISFPVLAQVTPDGTTSTTVTPTATGIEINNGNVAGENLFHSFGEFSVPAGGEAFFNNADSISNIFSRVTGGNISNIDGILRANGTANLFLINPAGIVFGEGARLQLGGSFYGSTANSIVFPDGEFSATDLDNPPLITINAPIGLNFRDDPQPIVNQANFGLTETTITPGTETEYTPIIDITGLEVAEGKNLALIGGDIILEKGGLTAPGGRIDLGGLSQAGTVSINADGSFSFPEEVTRSDVSLSDNSRVDIRGNGGGAINVNTRNLKLEGSSRLFTGIAEGMGSLDAVGGDIIVNATDSVEIIGTGNFPSNPEPSLSIDTAIISWVGLPPELRNPGENSTAVGRGGSIIINTQDLSSSVRDAGILNFTYATGSTGAINIKANSISFTNSGAGTFSDGKGDALDVNIEVNNFAIDNGFILSQVLPKGEGNAGNINVNTNSFNTVNSFIGTDNNGMGEGRGGDINITSSDGLTIDGGNIQTVIKENAAGDSGDINLLAPNIELTGGVNVVTEDRSPLEGNAGNITIESDNLLSLDSANLTSSVVENASGNSGEINIFTKEANITNSSLNTKNTGQNEGNAGNITIESTDNLLLSKTNVISTIENNVAGNSGSISFTASDLTINEKSFISSENRSPQDGNAGDVSVRANNYFQLDNSILSANVPENAVGNSGDISVSSPNINIDNNSFVLAQVQKDSEGSAGNINFLADNHVFIDNNSFVLAQVKEGADGDSGDINITTNLLTIKNKSFLISDSAGVGNGGNITLEIGKELLVDNKSLIRSGLEGGGVGDAGDITINSPQVLIDGDSDLSLGTKGIGNAGSITINSNLLALDNAARISSSSGENAEGNGGEVTLNSDLVSINNESSINVFTTTSFDGGSVNINANSLELTQGGAIFAATDGEGSAGNIQLNIRERIFADGSNPPEVEIEEKSDPFLDFVLGKTGLFADTSGNSTGDGGNIIIGVLQQEGDNFVLDDNNYTNQITLENGASINADSSGTGAGGSITLQSRELNLNDSQISATTTSLQEESNSSLSNIDLSVAENLTLRNNSQISTEAGSNADAGGININAEFILAYPSNGDGNDIVAKAQEGVGGDIEIVTEGLFGMAERTAFINNGTNDIDASSESGISGNVSITTPDNNSLRETPETSDNVVSQEIVAASNSCAASTAEDASGLVVKGRGGVPPEPTEPFSADAIVTADLANSNSSSQENANTDRSDQKAENTNILDPNYIPSDIEPVMHDENGEPVYIARGLIVKPDGGIILTAYPTENIQSRQAEKNIDCQSQ